MQLTDEATIGQVLHARFVAGDPVAPPEIFDRYESWLMLQLKGYRARKNLYGVDDTLIEAAVVQALGNYLTGSDTFDPSKGKTLGGYLQMSAEGDLLNLLGKQQPRDGIQLVELQDADRNSQSDGEPEFADEVAERMELDERRKQVMDAVENDEERVVLDLMLGGERSNKTYAAALGWPDPANPRHAKQVNKIKERLSKRLKRRFAKKVADD